MPSSSERAAASRQERIQLYKEILRDCLDRRPSGARQKIARVLGTHRSFVSQITNPADPTAIPARHVALILELVHASPNERERFLAAYHQAHPKQSAKLKTDTDLPLKTVHIEIPVLPDPSAQAALEDLVRDTVSRLVAIARMQSDSAKEE